MNYKKYEQGVLALNNDDNMEWIDKISCWLEEEGGYNIYIFQVIINDENDLSKYYGPITAAIATEFQTNLEKKIEKWNLYLIFECENKISTELKNKIEQDKYSTRKMVWDNLDNEKIGNGEYLRDRLLNLNVIVDTNQHIDNSHILYQIEEIDKKLYETLLAKDKGIEVQAAIYLGGNNNE